MYGERDEEKRKCKPSYHVYIYRRENKCGEVKGRGTYLPSVGTHRTRQQN